jgi:hypothetical protein
MWVGLDHDVVLAQGHAGARHHAQPHVQKRHAQDRGDGLALDFDAGPEGLLAKECVVTSDLMNFTACSGCNALPDLCDCKFDAS